MQILSKKMMCIMLLLPLVVVSRAQECVGETPAQATAINKAVNAIKQQFARLQAAGWLLSEEQTGAQSPIAKKPSPYRPMMLCSRLYKVSLIADPASNYGQMLQDSVGYYTTKAHQSKLGDKAWKQATKNMARLMDMQILQVTVTENEPYLVYGSPGGENDRNTVLHIKNVPFAYRQYIGPADDYSIAEETTWLYIGNWAGIKELKNNYGYMPYPFIHKQPSSVIETLTVTIKAPAPVADAIIAKIDWNALSNALSK